VGSVFDVTARSCGARRDDDPRAVPSFRRCSSRARLRPPGRISPGQRSS